MRTLPLVSLLVLSVTHLSCSQADAASKKDKSKDKAAPEPAAAPAPPPAPVPEYAKDLLAAMDTTVSACDDFYQYACGSWIKNTALPADKPAWFRSFSSIQDQNLAAVHTVLEATAKDPGTDPVRQKLGAYYGSCMNEDAANTAGITPIKPLLAEIEKVKDITTFMSVSGKLGQYGITSAVGGEIDGDFKDPTISLLYIAQDGLTLPDRDYYLKDDAKSKSLMTSFQSLVERYLERAGVAPKDSPAQAAAIIAFEKQLAEASIPRADLRDPQKLYNKMNRAELIKAAPNLKLDGWLTAMGAPKADAFSYATPESLNKFSAILAKTPVATLKAYLKFQTVHAFAGALDKDTYALEFGFFGTQLVGQQQPEDRWKRCVKSTDGAMGEALGQAFVDARFTGESKTIARAMINNIERAFREGLPSLSWMDDATRTAALSKVAAVNNKIGYPDKWRDYSALTIGTKSFAENVQAARAFSNARELAKIGQPVDRAEWGMSPPTVNAYYNPTLNEMVFPAGILQPPFFSKDYPAAMNYGAIGMVMGHELTHGFDDQGAQFDGTGKMVEWWAPQATERFKTQTSCVQKQYDNYTVLENVHVNGSLTLGENIADLGGTRFGYRAFKAQESVGMKANVPGLTDDQVYFLAFAQGWCAVEAEPYQQMLISADPHSPPKWRVNGPLTNLPEFHKAFNCPVGAKMHPESTCEVW